MQHIIKLLCSSHALGAIVWVGKLPVAVPKIRNQFAWKIKRLNCSWRGIVVKQYDVDDQRWVFL
jgi:hypothetical protein